MLVFQKIVRTYLMDGPLLKNSLWFSLSLKTKRHVSILSLTLCVKLILVPKMSLD